jgi:hypothetical protein
VIDEPTPLEAAVETPQSNLEEIERRLAARTPEQSAARQARLDAMKLAREAVAAAIVEFSRQLQVLRDNAPDNAPTLRELIDNDDIPRSTAYAILAGKRLPITDHVRTLVTAWEGDVSWWLDWRARIAQARRRIPQAPRVHRTSRRGDPVTVGPENSTHPMTKITEGPAGMVDEYDTYRLGDIEVRVPRGTPPIQIVAFNPHEQPLQPLAAAGVLCIPASLCLPGWGENTEAVGTTDAGHPTPLPKIVIDSSR